MNHHYQLPRFSTIACLTILLLVGGTAGQLLIAHNQPDSLTLTQPASYHFTWETGTATAADQGWLITNDLGYTVHLHSGYLASATIELLPCDSILTSSTWTSWLTPAVAHAGHGQDDPDPSRVVVTLLESLTELETTSFTTTQTAAENENKNDYCQAYYLVAPQQEKSLIPTMTHNSLYLQGTYTAPNTTEPLPFTLQTHLPWGTFTDIQFPTTTGTQLTVQRHLDTLFDGVSFNTQTPDQQTITILRNILENTTFIWE